MADAAAATSAVGAAGFSLLAIIIIFLIAILLNILISIEFHKAAIEKGYNSPKYFWYCFLLGIAGYLLVIALPNRSISRHN